MTLDDLPFTPDCHAVVVGAGGSAPKYYEWIKHTGCVLVAPSTMLLPLQRAGIFPDYVCIMDPSAVMPLHFRGTITDAALVYSSGVERMCHRHWRGLKYTCDGHLGPSVIHLCVDVALRLGASTISLVGVDFCFSNGKSHAEGVVTAYKIAPNSIETLNARSEVVKTEISLLDYAPALEAQIAENPHVKWLRMGKDGLPLEGVEYR